MDPMSDEEIIASAEKAAPGPVAKNATIIAMDEQMNMRTVREGSNGFTCMADNPQSPGTDPMCLDKGGMEWAGARMSKTEPPKGVVGLGYMLAVRRQQYRSPRDGAAASWQVGGYRPAHHGLQHG